jgi:hypothetical protein
VVGDRDQYVDAATFAAEQARVAAAGIPFDAIEFAGAHVISRSVFPRLTGQVVVG